MRERGREEVSEREEERERSRKRGEERRELRFSGVLEEIHTVKLLRTTQQHRRSVFRYCPSIKYRGVAGVVEEAGVARRASEPTRIRRKQPNFDPPVDNDSRKRRRTSSTVLQPR